MAALIEPVAACVEFLVASLARPMFEKSLQCIMLTISKLSTDDFRDKVSILLLLLLLLLLCTYKTIVKTIQIFPAMLCNAVITLHSTTV